MLPFIIYKSDAKIESKTVKEVNNVIKDKGVATFSGSGWNDKKCMLQWANLFVEMIKKLKLSKVLLVIYGYNSHHDVVVTNLLENN